jgi:hypothetical protein
MIAAERHLDQCAIFMSWWKHETAVGNFVPNNDWAELAYPVHRESLEKHATLEKQYPWKDNIWFVFWDRSRQIAGTIHCSTSFNGAPRTARVVLAHEGRLAGCDETPDVGRLSTRSIDVDGALQPMSASSDHHRIRAATGDFGFDLTLTPRWQPMNWTHLHLIPALCDAPELDHWQQGFFATGHVKIGGARLEFDGGGFRDRTWGWRAESRQFHELYGVNVGLEKCDVSMAKFLLADGTTKTGGYIQDDRGQHVVHTSKLTYNKAGLAAGIRIEADDLAPLILDAGPADAGWWLTFNKAQSEAPVWTEYHHLTPYAGGVWGEGYGCVAHDVLRKLS